MLLFPPSSEDSLTPLQPPAAESAASLRLLTVPQLKEKCKLRVLKARREKRSWALLFSHVSVHASRFSHLSLALQVTGTKEELVARLTGAPPPPKKAKVAKAAAAVPGIDASLLRLLDYDALKKEFKELTKSLARTVDADWHDSYEETDQELHEYI